MLQVNVNGAALKYLEKGNGEPVVFVHGSASDYRTWHLPQDPLAGRFRVVRCCREQSDLRFLMHPTSCMKTMHPRSPPRSGRS